MENVLIITSSSAFSEKKNGKIYKDFYEIHFDTEGNHVIVITESDKKSRRQR